MTIPYNIESMEQFLTNLPIWVLTIISLLWAAEKFVLPFFSKYRDQRQSDTTLHQIRAELTSIKKEMIDCETRYDRLDESYRALQIKYTNIMGMLRGFQIYLKDKGMADFPMMDDLIRHAGEK